MNYIYTKLHR